MELRDITMADLPLYEGLLTDPEVMTELGGPLDAEVLPEKLADIVERVERDELWYMVIEEDGRPAGTICIWDHDLEGAPVTEIGWMVAPAFQGHGLASRATGEILRRAREDGRWSRIHAYPGVTNGASNAICRKAGFERDGEMTAHYMGREIRCNVWRLDLA